MPVGPTLNPSHFRPGVHRKVLYKDFEKPDLLDTLEHLGVTDLTYHNAAQGVYLNGPCPLHQAQRNMTTFVVWPNIQRCACLSCHPERMDVIDLWMKLKGVSYQDTLKAICTPLSQEQALLRSLQQESQITLDLRFYAERINELFDVLDFEPAKRILLLANEAIREGQLGVADRILRRGNV